MVAVQSDKTIVGKTFRGETIRIDGQHFINCRFEGCTLEFGGETLPYFEQCHLVNVAWSFTDAAGATIGFLQLLRNSFGEGGKQVVEHLFELINDDNIIPGFPTAAGEMYQTARDPEKPWSWQPKDGGHHTETSR